MQRRRAEVTIEWIDSNEALVELCAHLRQQPFVALDTEFHRERTFYAHLALVQLASTERVACVDPLASLDLGPLDALMHDSGVLKVVHAGQQDLEIFFDRTKQVPAPIFDTQIAASLLGLGDQLGYAALVAEVTGTHLEKLHGRTDWMRRPLDNAVVEYAAGDVIHLREVYARLDAELLRLGRRDWLDEEQAYLLEESTHTIAIEDAWTRVKGAGKLKRDECAVAQQLAGWRERSAREMDRPRRRVLSDEAIVDLARQRPTKAQGLERLRSLDDGTRRKHGSVLIDLVRAGVETEEADRPSPLDRGPRAPFDSAVVNALAAVLQVRASAANINARMLCNKPDLEKLASGDEDLSVLRGWRARLAGDALQGFLAGRARLEVEDRKLVIR
jgi:ribonuclease D